MILRNEVFANGVCVSADIYDLATNTYSREESGTIVATRPMTAEEIAAYTPAPPVPTAEERIAAAGVALASAADILKQPVTGSTTSALRTSVDNLLTLAGEQIAAAAAALVPDA